MTAKEFRSILPSYLGQQALITNYNGESVRVNFCSSDLNDYYTGRIAELKLMLRPVSDMTPEEKKYYDSKMATVFSVDPFKDQVMTESHLTIYLCARGIDLFGLIETGYAIDKTITEHLL